METINVSEKDLSALEHPGSISFEHISTKLKPYEWGLGTTPRTANLRDEVYSKAVVVKDWADVLAGLGKTTFRKDVRLDVDRARIVTEAHKETEGKPMVIRKAMSIKKLCEELPIFIEPGQLIVGDPNSAPDEVRWYPEAAVDYMKDAIKPDGGFAHMLTEEEKKVCLEVCEYWENRCNEALVMAALPDRILPYIYRGPNNPCAYSNHWASGRNIIAYDFEVLFKEGFNARIARVEAELAKLEADAGKEMGDLTAEDYLAKKYNWKAMIICAEAIIHFADRYAELAEAQAKEAADDTRRKELQEVARICRKVPANPPETFQEAIQFFWFVEVVGRYLTGPNNGSGARIDQIFYPYYEKDIREGRITRKEAQELVECWMVRVQAIGAHAEIPQLFTLTSGGEVFYTANIGGTNMDGTDACNDLTSIFLEGLATLRINQPPLMFRFHRNLSDDMITRITETVRSGTGHPSLFNEDLMEKWALMRGYSEYDAKRTQAGGCVAMNCTGKTLSGAFFAEIGIVAQGKMLEYALFQGEDASGQERGIRPLTMDPREATSAEELLEIHCEQLRFYIEVANTSHNVGHQILMDIAPDPTNNFLIDDTLEQGKDLHKVWAEFDTWPNIVSLGFINVSDSLAAIDKLVFKEKKYTMDQLINALRKNWEGLEEMRQDFLNAPKYGNDDDYADNWAIKSRIRIVEEFGKVKDSWGRPWAVDGSSVIAYQAMALGIGATPDGRHAADLLADGSRSPSSGSDVKGPTAVLNSVGKVPFLHSELFNQRFMPQFLEGDNKVLFNEYLREWYEKMTIPHIQFNVVDSNLLRKAQETPDKYSDLQVRIAGYSAYFVDLAPETQLGIIDRTEQGFA